MNVEKLAEGMFQSSPLIAEGRYMPGGVAIPRPEVFQSSPLIAEGRYEVERALKGLQAVFQSSPLIAEGRYGPASCPLRRTP